MSVKKLFRRANSIAVLRQRPLLAEMEAAEAKKTYYEVKMCLPEKKLKMAALRVFPYFFILHQSTSALYGLSLLHHCQNLGRLLLHFIVLLGPLGNPAHACDVTEIGFNLIKLT